MRVNIVHMGFFYAGGGERVAIQQALLLRKRGHEVKVFSPIIYAERSFPELLKEVGPERLVPHLPIPFPFRESSALFASAILPFGIRKVADCDVLLCHSQPSMWLGYRLNALYGLPYVGYLHQLTTFIHRRPEVAGAWNSRDFSVLDGVLGGAGRGLARLLDKQCHLRASKLLFNSRWTRQRFEEEYGLSGEVCYPAIGPPLRFSQEVPRKHQLVTAARHYPWKRIDLAFQVLDRLESPKPNLLVMGGETPHTPSLRKMAAQSLSRDLIKFTGYVDDSTLARNYAESKVYLQTSVYEPFGLCVHPQTHVITSGGVINAEKVQPGQKVLSADGEWHEVYAKTRRKCRSLVRIVPWSFNIPAMVSQEHPCLVIKRKPKERFGHAISREPEWLEAAELRKGDILVYPRTVLRSSTPPELVLSDYSRGITSDGVFTPTATNQYSRIHRVLNANPLKDKFALDEGLMRLLGAYVAEGSASMNGAIEFDISQKEDGFRDEIISAISHYFELGTKSLDRSDTKGRRIWCCSAPLARMLRSLFGDSANQKHIPMDWIGLDPRLLRGFLEGLFRGDGNVYKDRKGKNYQEFETSSVTLFNQVKLILLKIGVFPFHFSRKRVTPRKIGPVSTKGSLAYYMAFSLSPSGKRRTGIDEKFVYLPIRKISLMKYHGEVVDLAIAGSHNFLSDSIVLHNSPVEAQSYGTPAVVWGDAGVRETVADGVTGFHARPYDVGDFAAKVDRLLSNESEWSIMSREAAAWASTFTWERHVNILERVLAEAAEEKRR